MEISKAHWLQTHDQIDNKRKMKQCSRISFPHLVWIFQIAWQKVESHSTIYGESY
jgi:hypothetical protein